MVPHQIYQALSQQRGHELKATARRHELTAAAELTSENSRQQWSRVKNAVARMAALVHPSTRTATSAPASSGPARSASRAKATATSTAGPMGCIA